MSTRPNTLTAIYVCSKRACRSAGKEFPGMPPSYYRAATGSSAKCPTCGAVLFVRRMELRP